MKTSLLGVLPIYIANMALVMWWVLSIPLGMILWLILVFLSLFGTRFWTIWSEIKHKLNKKGKR